ncbi:MAG: primosomal protein N' [Flavobacteriales bacterium]|nr:primosomal protein N' [Flavobacteriales bacterium]MBK7240818.1 primosomal protein N' [Flavobacteriales bacterium]MBP9139742.1 primosomal protein N' [Flavobacteriales bacterium]HQV53437.1 primosomal protein N' [Flavobacteriales bacterium]HQX31172.1 primosomal protein N' [Flavobacteriales bacterium]
MILPLAVPGQFTYALPELFGNVEVGMRVVVPFGRGRKLYSGLVHKIHDLRPSVRNVREVVSVLDVVPIVTKEQLDLWKVMADHYLCTLGEVMIAALPAQLSLSSETRLIAGADIADQPAPNARAVMLLDALELRQVITLDEAGEILGLKDPMPLIKALMDSGHLLLEEELRNTWKPRTYTFVKLTSAASSEEALHGWFDKMERAPKQLHVLMRFIELSRCMSDSPLEVDRTKLIHASGASTGVVKQLVDKGIFELYEREAGAPSKDRLGLEAPELSAAQTIALTEVQAAFMERDVVLLQGVTSSGKTEVYTTLIDAAIKRGEQVLYLLPEIALTTQIIARLRERFGEDISVFHSRMAQYERTALWLRCSQGADPPRIIIGARSALFLPFRRLGLLVVDEEHDSSYKQHDPAPRYNARDMAVVLSGLHGAKTLMGSATPSMESQHNARTGKYGHVRLDVRFGDVALPHIERVDLHDAYKRKTMRGHFSATLIDAIQKALDQKKQAIIFQNRRGYVPVWQCETCSWVPECEHCDVSLTYHKQMHQLRCHYCGRHYPPPTTCGNCNSPRLRMLGLGTEKIEEELTELFPDIRVARMDQDTTRGKNALENILSDFGQGKVQILVGTQMVTKGLDFDHVSVVGILNADTIMRYPDFRAHERAFQLMAQVAGRSGRRGDAGTVIIQAQEVHHEILDLVSRHDTDGMYEREIVHRRTHGYPPFIRLIELTLKHKYEDRVAATASALGMALREGLGDRVLGPDIPLVSRVRDKHLRKLLIKVRRSAHQREKDFVRDTIDKVFSVKENASVQLVTDVDPM